MFLASLEEIKGQRHRLFVEPAYAHSPEYQDFWRKLNSGEYVAAEFKRIGKAGKEVWIQASYNPIFDLNYRVSKITKFAIDITEPVRAVNEIGAGMERLANNDVETRIEKAFGPAFENLRSDFNSALKKLRSTLLQVTDSMNAIHSGTRVGHGVTLVNETGKSLERIMGQVTEITTIVAQIAAGAKEQSIGLGEVNKAINQMDEVTQQNAAMVEQTTAAGHSLSQETEHLAVLGQFQIGPGERQRLHAPRTTMPSATAAIGARAETRKPASRPARAGAKSMVVNGAPVSTGEDGWTEF